MDFVISDSWHGEVIFNVFRTGPVIELEKLPDHDLLVRLAVEPQSDW